MGGRCFCVETFQSRDAVLPPYDQGGVTASLQSFKSRFSSSSSSSSSSSFFFFLLLVLLCVFLAFCLCVAALRSRGAWRTGSPFPVLVTLFSVCLGCPVAAFKAATAVTVFGSLFSCQHISVVFSLVLFLLHRHVLGRSLEHPHARIHGS